MFLSFKSDQFFDPIDMPGGEISWELLHEVYDKDEKLPAKMQKASKLLYKAIHPGDNKQIVPLPLAFFDQSTSAAIEGYYPNWLDVSSFLKLVNIWWRMNNSKQEFNTNFCISNAAVKDDKVITSHDKSAEQKLSKANLEQADKYCSCHYSPMYCVPY